MAHTRTPEKQIVALASELQRLSKNLWWTWNPDAADLFRDLSPGVWERSNHNAVEVMQWIRTNELRARLQDPEFADRVRRVARDFQVYLTSRTTWADRHAAPLKKGPVAYFCAEFGLHESLRTYSGGLGILSGDHAKSASDLGLPFYGITLFYRHGYFQQQMSGDGWQLERYPAYDPARLPLRLVTDKKGHPVTSSVQIGNDTVRFQGWAVDVGRVTVYLLDTDLPENDQRFRNLTAHVYGGDQWTRISQEIVLGIGGVRFLRALGLHPSVFHMNEGHSAFLTLELLREQIEGGTHHDEAERRVKQQCVFTTHTPVPAGHDRFDLGLISAALSAFSSSLSMPVDRLMGFGRIHPQDAGETFTMTVLALRMSRAANGVSELHGRTSQEMWKDLYPGTPVSRVPIGGVTNGVHLSGWTTGSATRFWTAHLGQGWAAHLRDPKYWKKALSPSTVSDEDLWAFRLMLRREMIEFVRARMREQALRTGADADRIDTLLSPDVLTIGFARRFATYKRAPLLFRDIEWAVRMLTDPERPVQLIFAGKAHPRDDAGKQFIQQIIHTARRPELASRVVFIEDYDINVARHLVSGADVWLNTPRRPMEACGTSGMKTILHGCLHLSTMDGWWREAFDGANGWKIGEDTTASSEQLQDDLDAASLRSVMENKIIPSFYDRGKDGIPKAWLKTMRHAIATLAPVYNTDRMVVEYTTNYYLP